MFSSEELKKATKDHAKNKLTLHVDHLQRHPSWWQHLHPVVPKSAKGKASKKKEMHMFRIYFLRTIIVIFTLIKQTILSTDECFHLKIKNKATMEKTAQNYVKDVNCLKISYFISLIRKASTLAVKMSFAIDLLS